jgi:RimJ/RimL family protein N-acetyltransferase
VSADRETGQASDRRIAADHPSLPIGYRADWESDVALLDGSTAHIRPIRPSDAESLIAFHEGLSPETVRLRFFSPHPHLQMAEVEHFTQVDYHDRVALVAFSDGALVGVGRYERLPGTSSAEVAFVVADQYQGRGLGTVLLEMLAAAGRSCQLDRFFAEVLAGNHRMLEVFRHTGFPEDVTFDEGVMRVTLSIKLCPQYQLAHERRARVRRPLA